MLLNRSTKLLSVIVLVGALSLVTGVPWVQPASAIATVKRQEERNARLPKFIANEIRRDLSRRVGVPLGKLRIKSAQPRTWKDNCLELAAQDELCGQSLVEGWQVVVASDRQTWVYHTDAEGRVLRLATDSSKPLSATVENAVFSDIAQRANVSRSSLRVVQAEPKTWSDGCLGLAEGVFCTEALVPGWLVTVEGREMRWVYRTNRSGSVVKLDREATGNNLTPTRLSSSELPPALEQNVIFRSIATGGFTGQTQQTVLLNDGRMIRSRLNPDGTASIIQTTQVSRQQVSQFQTSIAGLKAFDRLNYRATPGSADFITVTLSSQSGTVQYADSVQTQLPQPLKTIISAWQQVLRDR